MKKHTIQALTFLAIICSPLSAAADDVSPEQTCDHDKVKVCFSDGDCYCTKRVVELQDPVPQIISCEDPNDSGVCSGQS